MIFIGGVQPRTKVLEKSPRLCRACNFTAAYLKRIDHYLSLFFIPLFPVKRGEPMLICDSCGAVMSPTGEVEWRPQVEPKPEVCPKCAKPVSPEFEYCPYCGGRLG